VKLLAKFTDHKQMFGPVVYSAYVGHGKNVWDGSGVYTSYTVCSLWNPIMILL